VRKKNVYTSKHNERVPEWFDKKIEKKNVKKEKKIEMEELLKEFK
jgi:hypothetical protein